MIAPTHLIAGQFAYLSCALLIGHKPSFDEALIAAGAGLLPDIDKPQGLVGRIIPGVSHFMDHHIGHRTLTHSLLVSGILVILTGLFPYGPLLALAIGYASHPLVDMMTPSGVAWFWPSRARCIFPGNVKYRMEVMSLGELWFVILMTIASFPLLAASSTGSGPVETVRTLLGDLESARHRYNELKGKYELWLELEGTDNLSNQSVKGKFRAIGPYQETGLIVEGPRGARAVCKEGGSFQEGEVGCNWLASRAVLIQGEPEQTTGRAIVTQVIFTDDLVKALEPLKEKGRVYLLGSLGVRKSIDFPILKILPTVKVSNNTIMLSYASPDVLIYLRKTLENVQLLAQVRHAPGIEVPEVQLPKTRISRIPQVLQKYLPQEVPKVN